MATKEVGFGAAKLPIKKFDINGMVDHCTIAMIAKRATGKSFLTREIMYQKRNIASAIAISRTEKTMVFNNNEAINTILNYPEPSHLSVVEIVDNQEPLDVLSSLDYTEPNYNKIYDPLYPDNINALKLIKKHTSRGRYNCSYKKTISGKGRYYIDSSAKKSHASLQNCY